MIWIAIGLVFCIIMTTTGIVLLKHIDKKNKFIPKKSFFDKKSVSGEFFETTKDNK